MNKVWIKKVVAFAFVMSVGMAFADVVTSFGINFCHGNDNTVSPTDTDTVGFSKGQFLAPNNWFNFEASAQGDRTVDVNGEQYSLTWSANGGWNNGSSPGDDNVKKILYGYLDSTTPTTLPSICTTAIW